MSLDNILTSIKNRVLLIVKSWRALPLWVEIWVLYLFVANLLCVFTSSPQSLAIAICGSFILVTNTIVVIVWAGFTKVMSFFHVIAWVPLEVYLGLSVILSPIDDVWPTQEIELWSYNMFLVVIVFITNLISLGFDFLDCFKYIKGDRHVPGHPLPGENEYNEIHEPEEDSSLIA